jgi:hypothetical protein
MSAIGRGCVKTGTAERNHSKSPVPTQITGLAEQPIVSRFRVGTHATTPAARFYTAWADSCLSGLAAIDRFC